MKPATISISRLILGIGASALAIAPSAIAQEPALYFDPKQPVEARVEDLLARMTMEEKISLIHADSKFSTAAIPRLGVPRRWMSDGPNGVREDIGPDTWEPSGHTDDFATAVPTAVGLAATWNPDIARRFGSVIGEEAKKRGKQIMLGPAVNIHRTPLCGRNFEYMGEDPFLTSRIAVGYIKGEQSQGVASCVKHFAVNNQEVDRFTVDVEVDERALREIYLPAFRAAVQEAGVLSVMGAYNELRGIHCCQNDYLLNHILKGEWGFQGLVMSDWAGTHDTCEAVRNGLDLEMGTDKPYNEFYLADPFLSGLKDGTYSPALLDEKVRRNLRVMFLTHMFDPPSSNTGSINTAAHQEVARLVAEDGIVLLKNDQNALPLDADKIKSIAVIGENATRLFCAGGLSSGIKAFYEINALTGILNRAGAGVNITYSMGYHQPPQKRRRRGDVQKIDPQEIARQKQLDADLADQAVAAAKQAEQVIYVGGLSHAWNFDTESSDRKDLKLPYGQAELIQRIVQANPHTVVVLNSGGGVEMDQWLSKVPAIVEAWYPGMEGGNAIAHVLFGDVNPSGKLPCTFPKRLEDSPAHAMGNYPGKDQIVHYEEGLLVGYRWFDTKNIEPLFPFGFGLSYTQFDYSNLHLVPGAGTDGSVVTVQCDLTNTGQRDGAEVVQVYVHQHNPTLPRPEKELKGFAKVFLKAGEKQTVAIPLNRSAFAFYDPAKPGWVSEQDAFDIRVGSSSRDIRQSDVWKLEQASVEK